VRLKKVCAKLTVLTKLTVLAVMNPVPSPPSPSPRIFPLSCNQNPISVE
jgi:hypothetical protein